MSDHRFEKQVGQKLSDLKLTPSTRSWENIENELRKDKRRPAPIFWLPLLLLGLGAIGYYVFTGVREMPESGLVAGKTSKEKNITNRPTEPIIKKPNELIIADKPGGTDNVENGTTENRAVVSKLAISGTEEKTVASLKVSQNHSITDKQIFEQSSEQGRLNNSKQETEAAEKKEETNKEEPEKTEEKADSTPVSSATPKPGKKKTKKWSFGINASGGLSSLSEGKLSFSNAQIATVVNRAPSFSFASPAVMPPPATSPSKIYPGFSFSVGLTTKYNLSKRFSLSTGINYLQINTITKVGYKLEQSNNAIVNMDKTVAEIMYLPPANDQVRDYDNKYHFIEIPLNLHTRINKSEKIPIYWNAGFSVSKLIKSNSLHYDAVEHYYYSDDNLLKKTQTAISTGFSVLLFNKSSKPLWIGPSVRYNLSQALKKESSPSNKHFMGLGLDVKWFIK